MNFLDALIKEFNGAFSHIENTFMTIEDDRLLITIRTQTMTIQLPYIIGFSCKPYDIDNSSKGLSQKISDKHISE
jgi:hypothetical protein